MKPLLLGERSNPLKSWMGDAKRREEAVISVHKALQHSVGNWVSSFIYVVVFPSALLSPPSFGIECCNPGTASPCTLAKWPERIQRPEGSWMNAFDKTNAFHGSWIEIRSGEKITETRLGLVFSDLVHCLEHRLHYSWQAPVSLPHSGEQVNQYESESESDMSRLNVLRKPSLTKKEQGWCPLKWYSQWKHGMLK